MRIPAWSLVRNGQQLLALRASKEGKHTFSGEQCDGSSLRSSATSTPNTMNVVFRVVRVIVVEDMSDVLDIFNGVSMQQTS